MCTKQEAFTSPLTDAAGHADLAQAQHGQPLDSSTTSPSDLLGRAAAALAREPQLVPESCADPFGAPSNAQPQVFTSSLLHQQPALRQGVGRTRGWAWLQLQGSSKSDAQADISPVASSNPSSTLQAAGMTGRHDSRLPGDQSFAGLETPGVQSPICR